MRNACNQSLGPSLSNPFGAQPAIEAQACVGGDDGAAVARAAPWRVALVAAVAPFGGIAAAVMLSVLGVPQAAGLVGFWGALVVSGAYAHARTHSATATVACVIGSLAVFGGLFALLLFAISNIEIPW